jgi:hypothetical protein
LIICGWAATTATDAIGRTIAMVIAARIRMVFLFTLLRLCMKNIKFLLVWRVARLGLVIE